MDILAHIGCQITAEWGLLAKTRPARRLVYNQSARRTIGPPMKATRALARTRYAFLSLLLECAIAIAALAATIATVPLAVILAAQLHGLAATGEWRGFRVAEFLDVLQIESTSLPGDSQSVEYLFSLPASLVLLTAALFLCLLAVTLHRLNRKERARFLSVQQRALIKDIERKLEMR